MICCIFFKILISSTINKLSHEVNKKQHFYSDFFKSICKRKEKKEKCYINICARNNFWLRNVIGLYPSKQIQGLKDRYDPKLSGQRILPPASEYWERILSTLILVFARRKNYSSSAAHVYLMLCRLGCE